MKTLGIFLVGVLPAVAGTTWCQPLVIQHAAVANSEQAGYVLTVGDTDPHLATAAHGGYVQNSDGSDIVFASDSYGQQLLAWDPLEVYDPVTGRMVTHVAVGTVSHTTDTTIYRCAGISVSAFQGSVAGSVWPSSYRLVEHFARASALDLTDSTSNANNGTGTGVSAVAGAIGGGASFNGSAYVSVANSSSLQITGPLTVSAWVKFSARPTSYTELVSKGSPYFLLIDGNPDVGFVIGNDYPVATNFVLPTAAVGSWAQVTGTYDSSNSQVKLYWNGSLVNTRTTANVMSADASKLAIGATTGGAGLFLNGALDEVRIVGAVLSADRITTDYNNQANPSAFYIPGSWSATQSSRPGGSQVVVF